MSDNPQQPGRQMAHDDLEGTKQRVREEMHSARAEAGRASESIREEASAFSDQARRGARDQAEKGKEAAASGLGDFAAAVRKASDELGSRDQSMASQIVREVAGGLEHASQSIHGRDLGELTQSVARFARERPATFLVGAALAGLALGRFARSSDEHGGSDHSDGAHAGASSGRSGLSAERTTPGDYRASYEDQPKPTEGAYPANVDPVTGARRHPADPQRTDPSSSWPAAGGQSDPQATTAGPDASNTRTTTDRPGDKPTEGTNNG